MKSNWICRTVVTLSLAVSSISAGADAVGSHGKRVLSVTGTIDERFHVRFAVHYEAATETALSCARVGPLPGYSLPPGKTIYHDVIRTHNTYAVELPLSEIPPGACQWKPYAISYSISETPEYSTYTSLIAVDEPDRQTGTSITYLCERTHHESDPSSFVFCWGNPFALGRSVTKDQQSLEVNFIVRRDPQLPK